jgi:WD40 repeat protein
MPSLSETESRMSRTVRIFISSPGDVAQERDRAREVIDSLRRRYAKRFVLQPLFWEDLPLQADMSFQEGIDTVLSEKGVDIAVFILWSRLGSPLGALIRRPDGSEYRSGTEREYDLMIRAREQTREREGKARPALLVYTRRDEVSFNELLGSARGTAEKRRLLEQKELVESFLQETFKDAETGANVGAYFPFDRPVTFSQRLRVHLQNLLDERAGDLDQVVWDIEKKGPPFLGLEAFQTEHAEIFFGREGEILEARRALKSKAAEGCAFLLISGASGSGKSSLARAGLLPEIAQHEIGEGQTGWIPVVVTPSELGADPLAGLVLRLAAGDVLPGLRDQVASLDDLARDLAREPEMMFRHTLRKTLEEAGKRKGGKLRLLVLIDQFEELFTGAVEREQLGSFLSFVEVLARSGDAWVVATARSDFYERLQQEPVLVRMKEGAGLFDLLPPGPDAIQRLIEEPARLAGLRFEERDGVSLASRLLRDAADHAELLPLLEFVLLELYRRRDAEGRLTFAAYEALGTGESPDGDQETGVVAGALAKRAEEVYSSLSPEAQGGLDRVLTRMVTFVENASDEETEKPLRRYAPLEEFDRRPGDRLLVDAFVAARLFTTREREGRAVVTLAHEALLRAWPRAVAWRKNNVDFLRMRARIEGRMREGARLLEGDPLLPAAQAAVAARPEGFDGKQLQYVGECVNEAMARRRSRERLRRRVMAGLAGLTLLAVAGAGWALKREREAEMARREADLERQKTKEALVREATLRSLAEDREIETKRAFARADFNTATELLDKGRSSEALGHLARALRMDPTNQSALVRSLNLLMDRNWPFLSAGGRVDRNQFPTAGVPDTLEHRVSTAIGESYKAVFDFKTRAAASYAGYFRYDFSAWDRNVFLFEQNLKDLCESEISMDFGGETIPLAYSPDGRWAGIPGQASAALVDRSDGSRIESARHEGRVACLAFSPDGKLLATGANDNRVKIWDLENRELFMEPIDHPGWILKVAFSSDGKSLAVESEEGGFLWDISDRRRLNFVADTEADVDSGPGIEWSPDPEHPLVALVNGSVTVIDYREGRERFRLLPGDKGATAKENQWVRFVDSGASLLRFGGGKLSKRETKLGKLVQEIDSQKPWRTISPLGASANSRILIPEDKDRSVLRVLDAATLEVKCRLHCVGSDRFKSAEFVQNGARVLTASESGLVSLFDAFTGGLESKPLPLEDGSLIAIDSSEEGLRVLVARSEGKRIGLQFLDVLTGKPTSTWIEHSFRGGFDHSTDERLFTSINGEELSVVDFSGKRRFSIREPDFFGEVDFIGRGSRIMTVPDRDGTCKFFDTSSGSRFPLEFPTTGTDFRTPSVSPDGGFAIFGGRLWEIETGRPLSDALVRTPEPQSKITFAPLEGKTPAWTVAWRSELPVGKAGSEATKRTIDFVPVLCPGNLVAPSWFPEFLEGLGGVRVEEAGTFSMVKTEERERLFERMRREVNTGTEAAEESPVCQVLLWWAEKRERRTINPFSAMTFEDWIEARIGIDTREGWREVLSARQGDFTLWEQYGKAIQGSNPTETKRANLVSQLLRPATE